MTDCRWTRRMTLCLFTALAFAIVETGSAAAQRITILHTFTAGTDGHAPQTGLAIDQAGRLYGTTYYGATGHGSVFQLRRAGTGWVLNVLYNFSGMDGSGPMGRPVFGPDGALYGTTQFGGHGCGVGCGVVYRLSPPPTVCTAASCPWIETVLYRFGGSPDGAAPMGPLAFDRMGNIYGATYNGGANGKGSVFELTPSNGSWTESVLYSFSGGADGTQPAGGVALDPAGNVFGTTFAGGLGYGTIFMLQPMNGNWAESTLHAFAGSLDGAKPIGGLISDGGDTFYGTTTDKGAHCPGTCVGAGTVFQFTYSTSGTSYSVIYEFPWGGDIDAGPQESLALDAAGNLYGTSRLNGLGNTGSVFELTRNGQDWTGTVLYSFSYFGPDGSYPFSNIVMDADGNLYGTAMAGGAGDCIFPGGGCGTVYQIRSR
jgi:uncharacterized repeat protein (TIGR03803 family)